MRFAEILVKNLLRRKARSLLTMAGVSLAVAATVVLLTVAWGYSDSAVSHYAASQVDVLVVRAGVAERITSSLSARLADRLRELPGVAQVDGSLTEMVSLGDGSLLGVPLHGLDPSGFAMAHYVVTHGRALDPSDRHTIILGAGLATALGKSPGDNVDLEGTVFSIAGVFQTGDALESNTAVATLGDLQELMDRPGQVSEFQIQVAPAAADAIAVRQLCGTMEGLADAAGNPLGFKAMPMRDFVAADTETGLLLGMAKGTSAIAIFLSSLGVLEHHVDVGHRTNTRIGNPAGGRLVAGADRAADLWANRYCCRCRASCSDPHVPGGPYASWPGVRSRRRWFRPD